MSDHRFEAVLSRRTIVKLSMLASAVALAPPAIQSVSAKTIVATMVTDTNGLGDQNFNDLADKGGKAAAQQLGITWKVIESTDASAYEPNLTAAAQQSDLTVGVGFLLTDAMTDVAGQFPDKIFLIIDSTSTAPNVSGVTFKENEPAFLAGVVAGKFTKTGKIGIVGGQSLPPVVRYEVGFRAGIQSVNPDIAGNVSVVYTDTFGDPTQGKSVAEAQFNQGADIVFPIAGATGTGCYQAAAEKGDGFWIVGADTTQDHLAPGHELCVAQKGVDTEVFAGIKSVVDGTFKGGVSNLGLKEGAVSLQDPNHRVPDDIMGLALAYRQMIIDGTLVVPGDYDTLKAFVPPAVPAPLPVASPVASPAASPSA